VRLAGNPSEDSGGVGDHLAAHVLRILLLWLIGRAPAKNDLIAVS
jgi:hypothetical protein